MRALARRSSSLRARLTVLFTATAVVAGVAGGLLLTRRLQLGLESDLDGVLRQRAAAVASAVAGGAADLTAAQGPVQVLGADGAVLSSAGGASAHVPLVDRRHLREVDGRYLIIDSRAVVGGDREEVRVLARPASRGRFVALAVGRDPVEDVVQRTLAELVLLGVPAMALLAAGAWLVTGAALHPVEAMRRQAASASPASPAVLTATRGGAELVRLAATLNDLLAAQRAALRAEQSFLADAGHELRTPLAILAGELELADRPVRTEAELRATITVARQETTRLVRLAEQLLVLARVDGTVLRRARTDLRALATQALALWGAAAADRRVELALDAPVEVWALVDASRLRQVLDNLLSNAVRAAPAGSSVEVSVRAAQGDGHPWAQLEVRDHGPGFDPGFLPHAFERFRRADTARTRTGGVDPAGPFEQGGTGLGLSVVERIAQAHGGRAWARNGDGGGAVVGISPPRDGAEEG